MPDNWPPTIGSYPRQLYEQSDYEVLGMYEPYEYYERDPSFRSISRNTYHIRRIEEVKAEIDRMCTDADYYRIYQATWSPGDVSVLNRTSAADFIDRHPTFDQYINQYGWPLDYDYPMSMFTKLTGIRDLVGKVLITAKGVSIFAYHGTNYPTRIENPAIPEDMPDYTEFLSALDDVVTSETDLANIKVWVETTPAPSPPPPRVYLRMLSEKSVVLKERFIHSKWMSKAQY
jgi:hypothetical protein